MNATPEKAPDESVLILAPLPDDETALREMVEAEGEAVRPARVQSFEDFIAAGAGCLLMTEDALVSPVIDPLLRWTESQPEWSALPVLILTRDTGRAPHLLADCLAPGRHGGLQLTLLQRPSAPDVLRNAIRNAMASRRRQYLIRDQVQELDDSRERLALLGREVQHRAKNSLTKVSVIARQTWRNSKNPEQFIESLERRIGATARGLDLMTETEWQGAKLADLFKVEVRAVLGENYEDRFTVDGEELALNYEAALALHLAAHELTTNALKYGAFSVDGGSVALRWRRTEEEGEEKIDLVWQERDGPSVKKPAQKGFGSKIVEQALALQIGGYVQTSYKPEGLQCRMVLPYTNLRNGGGS
ncbi:sensor histidine kinase [Hyphococcus sp.]|uniref:sensor histidine kinase n=1 Tax=Hyphococcus sp. TaxID=2038636 RepID=UPI0035C76C6F